MNITKNTTSIYQYFAKRRKEDVARVVQNIDPVIPENIRVILSRYVAGETDTIDDKTARLALSFLVWKNVVCEAELIRHMEQNFKRELTSYEKERRISLAKITFTGAMGTITVLDAYFPTSIKRLTPYVEYLDIERMNRPSEYREWLDVELLKKSEEKE